MNAPRWSYEIPSVSGWYWWQPDPVAEPRVVHLFTQAGDIGWIWRDSDGGPRYQKYTETGRWLVPIEPPMAHEAWRPDREHRR